MASRSLKILAAAGVFMGLGAWNYPASHPSPKIPIWDNSYDVMHCRRISVVSRAVYTDGLFGGALDEMIAKTIAAGGTDLYLRKNRQREWLSVTGIAYRCGRGPVRHRHKKIIKH